MRALLLASLLVSPVFVLPQTPTPSTAEPLHRPFDEILDIYVRDGLVYYNALKLERGRFDRYVQSLGEVTAETVKAWPRAQQLAFWINAYNAFVLRTVIDSYPIKGRAADFPANSVRQIPGAFERRTFRAGGRSVTLDALERDVIGGFDEPRALLALSRGATGGPRLKSEAYAGDKLESQLTTMTGELVTHHTLIRVDAQGNRLLVNPLFSWREELFTRTLASRAPAVFAERSPIERAVLSLIRPLVVPGEAVFLDRNQFQTVFPQFDWRLNDLTGR